MQRCHYNAQGIFTCPVIEGFVNSARTRGSTELENPDNGLFKNFVNAAQETDVGHIFSQCSRSSCRATGCEKSSQGQRCTVTCQCKRCNKKNDTIRASYSTEGKVWVTGKGSRSVTGMYYCGDKYLQTQPCEAGMLSRVGGFDASCPTQQQVPDASAKGVSSTIGVGSVTSIQRNARPERIVGSESVVVGTESVPVKMESRTFF